MPQSRSSARAHVIAMMFVACATVPSVSRAAPADDAFVAGYVTAILQHQLSLKPRSVDVKAGVVTLDGGDVPRDDRPKIVTSLMAVPGVTRVDFRDAAAPSAPAVAPASPAEAPAPPSLGFLPSGHLFRPLIADPRWPHFSAAYRYYTETTGPRDVFAATFGETIPLYRWSLGEKERFGQLEVGVQAGAFSTFNLGGSSFDLINTDFFAAGFVGYRLNDFSAMGRFFHQSSHLGDELLLSDTQLNRVNLSYEGLDAKLSYDLPLGLRAYGGGGYLVRVDPSDLARGFAQAGGEWRSPVTFWNGWLRPIAGLDLQFHQENDWRTDLSFRAGVQLESVTVLSRNLQILFEFFNGHSFDGQFYKESVQYVGIGAHFNF